MPSLDRVPDPEYPVKTSVPTPQAPILPVAEILDWSTAKGAYHATRVICDQLGLTVDEKNLICSCIYQESGFHNTAKNINERSDGTIGSTDWGLCQVNDRFHIGIGKDFPSVQYVLDNPDKIVTWMIEMYKHGKLGIWVSYSSNAYRKWLIPSSPMWLLKS